MGDMNWGIVKDQSTESTWRFIDSIEERFKAIKKMFIYIAAQELLSNVKDAIPKTDDYDDLRDSLMLSEIPGGREPAFSVHASMKSRKVRKIDQTRTVLYVRAKRGILNPAPEKIQFLEDNGPWTTDTIPFWPSKKQAVVVQRKVSKREADHVADMQQKQESKIKLLMQQLGIRQGKKDLASQKSKRNKAVPDTSFAALSLEYGQDGKKPVPAWRVGVGDVMRSGIKSAPQKYRQLKTTFNNPDNSQWKRWPKVKDKVKVSAARGYVPFMKKLGFV